MNKNIYRLIFVFICFISFSTLYNVDAASCRNSVTIKEISQADPTGWKAIYPVCADVKQDESNPFKEFPTEHAYPDARAIATQQIPGTAVSVDGKNRTTTSFTQCVDNKAYIHMELTYKIKYLGDPKEYGLKVNPADPYHWEFDYDKPLDYDPCSLKTLPRTCLNVNALYKCDWVPDVTGPVQFEQMSTLARLEVQGQCKSRLPLKDQFYDLKKVDNMITDYNNVLSRECKATGYHLGDSSKGEDPDWCYIVKPIMSYNDCYGDNYYFNEEVGRCLPITNAEEQGIKADQRENVDRDVTKVINANVTKCNNLYKPRCKRVNPLTGPRMRFFDDDFVVFEEDCSNIRPQKFFCESDEASASFIFNCPRYYCVVKDKTLDTCTPSFKVADTGADAYCVNPGNPFSMTGAQTQKFMEDPTFNALRCESTSNNVDCGYANILVESAYQNDLHRGSVPSKATELALRLWGAHNTDAGFVNHTGLSLRVVGSGGSCNTGAGYMANYNVYKRTVEYIDSNFGEYILSAVSQKDVEFGDYESFAITCPTRRDPSEAREGRLFSADNKYMSVTCGENDVYRKAIALYLMTLNGNRNYRAHLLGLGPDELENDIREVTYNATGDQMSYVLIKFEETEKLNKVIKYLGSNEVVLDCKKLERGEYNLTEAQKKEIRPYCNIKTTYYNKYDEVVAVKIKDANGNLVAMDENSSKVDECHKDIGCYKIIKTLAFCQADQHREVSKIGVKYNKSVVSNMVKKYISCANSGANGSQFMFSFYRGSSSVSNNEPVETVHDIVGYRCEEIGNHTFCSEDGVTISGSDNCSTGSFENAQTYNGTQTFKKSIKEPPLRCILNYQNVSSIDESRGLYSTEESATKQKYEYSNYFHLNRNICRVYCSDEMEYNIADKNYALSGKSFSYDILRNSFTNNSKMLTSVVKAKRNCAIEIYYNIPMPAQAIESIRQTYGLSESEWRYGYNWKDLYRVLVEKSQRELYRGEVVNQIIYDLLNCNLYKTNEGSATVQQGSIQVRDSSNNIVNVPRPSTYDPDEATAYQIVKNNYSSFYSNSNNTNILNASYKDSNQLGYYFAATDSANPSSVVKAKMSSITSSDNSIKNPSGKKSLIDNTEAYNPKIYCVNTSSSRDPRYDCFRYTIPTGSNENQIRENNYNMPSAVTTQTTNYNMRSTGLKLPDSYKNKTLKLPRNDYAFFSVETSVGMYNESRYQYAPVDGSVTRLGPTVNENDSSITDPYRYTVNKTAYSMCANSEGSNSTNSDIARCTIKHNIKVDTFYRNNSNDEFSRAVNGSQSFGCYVYVKKSELDTDCTDNCSNNAIFRYVDLSNLFPDGVSNNTNHRSVWINQQVLINKIQSSASTIKTDPDYIDYTITLTPTQIKALRDYGRNNNIAYSNEPIDRSTCTFDQNLGVYLNCQSVLLNRLRSSGNDSQLGVLVYDGYGRERD